MRKTSLAIHSTTLLIAAMLGARVASSAVNHGDFLGTSVDFKAVTEATQTAGDAEPLWEAPALAGSGDQLVFFPTNFTSICGGVLGASDTTASLLTTTIEAHGGGHIDNILLVENGDSTLAQFPPFGTNATNVSASISGTVTVLETTSGPIAPVVIPFVGSFVPSSIFKLPDNWGTSTWSGSISVNVAWSVPLATKVEFALTNTLAANCAPGNSSAKIQKKEVSGPSVAIMVNPIECALEVNKTCCVPQPVLPDLDICEGDVVRMVLEYTGEKCSASDNDQGKHFRCYGRRKPGEPVDITVLSDVGTVSATPDTGIQIGDTVEFTSSTGTLFDRTKFEATGPWGARQSLKMDTSCERALECGDNFGGFKLVELESTLGGLVDCSAPPPDPVCALPGDPAGTPCDAKLVDMVLEYNGQDCQSPLGNPQNGEATCDGDATGATNVGIIYAGNFGNRQQVSPSSGINDGDLIRVTATWTGGLFPNQKFLITNDSGIVQQLAFHVSCSQPLALGDEFGSFKLVEFTTKNGTQVALGDGSDGTSEGCEVPLAPPKPHCTSDLQSVTLAYIGDYLGEGCTTSNDQSGYASCSGDPNPGGPVSVIAGAGLEAFPVNLIEFGNLVTLTATGGGELPVISSLDVSGNLGSQSISFKTSCHKPLSLGDRFGSFVVFGMDREDDGAIALGGTVQYQYTVTNPNSSQVDNVTVDDLQLGVIASGLSIPAGESLTLTQMATLFGTTINVVNVTGDVGGDLCDPGIDQVRVDVVVPPDGAFTCSCSQSLTDVTLIWNGAQTVDIKAWNGAPGGSTLLATLDDVAPGEEVTVGGFTGDSSTWEIFDSTGVTKLGESLFHLTCRDKDMNGVEDCGKNEGNGKYDDITKLNDWLLEGMVDDDETMTCSPTFVPPPPACGFGPELMLLLPGLMWLHRRRIREA